MNIIELNNLIKELLINKQKDNLAMFRSIKTHAALEAKEKKEEINEKHITNAIIKEHKMISQTLETVPEEHDFYKRAKAQIEFLNNYMPAAINEKDLTIAIQSILEANNLMEQPFGVKMKAVIGPMKEMGAEGKIVSDIIKKNFM